MTQVGSSLELLPTLHTHTHTHTDSGLTFPGDTSQGCSCPPGVIHATPPAVTPSPSLSTPSLSLLLCPCSLHAWPSLALFTEAPPCYSHAVLGDRSLWGLASPHRRARIPSGDSLWFLCSKSPSLPLPSCHSFAVVQTGDGVCTPAGKSKTGDSGSTVFPRARLWGCPCFGVLL